MSAAGRRAYEHGRANCNPYVTRLRTLYSQSRVSNAGTRGLDDIARLTYVKTRLDDHLVPAIVSGEFRLLVLGRVYCLYRKSWCNVIGFTDAPIPWPVVRRQRSLGGHGLLVNRTMLRAIRFESASALMHHFGVGSHAVWNWRWKFLEDAARFATRGSRVLHKRASRAGAEAIKTKEWTDAELEAKAAAAKRIGLRPPPRWTPERGGWTAAEVKLLEKMRDADVAAKTGRTEAAARAKRRRITSTPAAPRP
jgi:hypothetical protein